MHRRNRHSSLVAATALLVTVVAANARAEDDEPAHTSGFMLGASVGYLAPAFGTFGGCPAAGPGPAIGVNAGLRRHSVYIGAAYAHGVLAGNGETSEKTVTWLATAATSDYVGIDVDWMSNPDGPISFVTHFSAGYRALSVTSTASFDPRPATTSTSGLEGTLLGVGMQINVGGRLRLRPEASLSVNPGVFGLFASMGLTAYYDIAVSPPSDEPSPSPASPAPKSAEARRSTPAPQADPPRPPAWDRWDRGIGR